MSIQRVLYFNTQPYMSLYGHSIYIVISVVHFVGTRPWVKSEACCSLYYKLDRIHWHTDVYEDALGGKHWLSVCMHVFGASGVIAFRHLSKLCSQLILFSYVK